jgi:hypothetical protein
MNELACNFEQFKRMACDFHMAAPTLELAQLDNAWKCLGLGYLNMTETMWLHSAAILFKMEMRNYLTREAQLLDNVEVSGGLSHPTLTAS